MAQKRTKRVRTDDLFPSHPNKPYGYPVATSDGAPIGGSPGPTGLSAPNFIPGVRPYEIVGALPGLPSSLYPQGAMVFLTTDNKLYRSTGSAWTVAVPTVDLTGLITSAQITDLAISTAKLADLSVVTGKLADLGVTTAKMNDLAVSTGKLADLSVVTGKLNALAVTGAKIADATITGGKLVADTITANEIAASAITSSELAANSVIAGKIAALTIVAGDIAANTITAGKIASHTITAAEIAALTITAAEIAANTITAAKITAATITATEIAANTITAAKIAALTITAAEIAANTITAAKIASHTITAAEITALTITAAEIAANTITAAKITAATITATELATDSVTTNKIQAGAVTAAKISVSSLDAIAGTFTGVLDVTHPTGLDFFRLRDSDVAHGMTTIAPTDCFGYFTQVDGNAGGLHIYGLRDDSGLACEIHGYHVGSGNALVTLDGAVASGTGVTSVAATDTVVAMTNNGTVKVKLLGNGKWVCAVGSSATLIPLNIGPNAGSASQPTGTTGDFWAGDPNSTGTNELFWYDGTSWRQLS